MDCKSQNRFIHYATALHRLGLSLFTFPFPLLCPPHQPEIKHSVTFKTHQSAPVHIIISKLENRLEILKNPQN